MFVWCLLTFDWLLVDLFILCRWAGGESNEPAVTDRVHWSGGVTDLLWHMWGRRSSPPVQDSDHPSRSQGKSNWVFNNLIIDGHINKSKIIYCDVVYFMTYQFWQVSSRLSHVGGKYSSAWPGTLCALWLWKCHQPLPKPPNRGCASSGGGN